jgi:hypothetical protein
MAMTDEQKAEFAIKLVERAAGVIPRYAKLVRESGGWSDGKTVHQTKIDSCLRLLAAIEDFFDWAPDPHWWRDYFILTGAHMVLTEEGWLPAECNTREATGADPMEVLDEVNAPGASQLPTCNLQI